MCKDKSKRLVFLLTIIVSSYILPTKAEAFSSRGSRHGSRNIFDGGAIAVGAGYSLTNSEQLGINSMIDAAKANVNSTVSKLTTATEYVGFLNFRFRNGFTILQIRPSVFEQKESGSGTDGAHSYELSGQTLFPIIKFIPMNNEIMEFYLQGGLGYGKLNGTIRNGARYVDFKGESFGALVGLGVEFCIIPDHCVNVEGNYRYLPIPRNLITNSSGAGNLPYGTSQVVGSELEDVAGTDISSTLSGVQGILGYTVHF